MRGSQVVLTSIVTSQEHARDAYRQSFKQMEDTLAMDFFVHSCSSIVVMIRQLHDAILWLYNKQISFYPQHWIVAVAVRIPPRDAELWVAYSSSSDMLSG